MNFNRIVIEVATKNSKLFKTQDDTILINNVITNKKYNVKMNISISYHSIN
jgi:hypothetical protein